MTSSHQPTPPFQTPDTRSGLSNRHRRVLARWLYAVTGVSLIPFAVLQIVSGHVILAGAELVASVLLFTGYLRVARSPHLQRWIYGYLIPLFIFFNVIIIVPEASISASVWVLMMPVLSYLLLGKREGMILCLPFMVAGSIGYLYFLENIDSARSVIDFLNLVVGGTLMLLFIHVYEQRREEAEQRLINLAQTDSLTGLANRNRFQELLARTIAESQRSNSPYALVVLDLDRFKQVNDTFGHEAGDRLLKLVGQTLIERLRGTDTVGRLGGEEFGLLLRDVSCDDTTQLIEQVRERIADTQLRYRGQDISVTASFGIAHSSRDGHQADALFRTADRRLYQGKRGGRNVVESHDEPSNDELTTTPPRTRKGTDV
ncbi:GGDEF domain-containing protein [Marinobacter zhejiangensis]|uniref:diguanylate cyclase n=1 Tax=Marinobacter zhejiangensis TaxID=488535 RepID=A0A1I4M0R6_9GAMM|nr:GGDEF domain-containing protein [Marinobacter zhejiangensis]SFL96665.1 diguanylate cyclase (GGDEF) domain-containing protein [Marinobacter zhejiangensis]